MGCGILDSTQLGHLLGKQTEMQCDFPVLSGPAWQWLLKPLELCTQLWFGLG